VASDQGARNRSAVERAGVRGSVNPDPLTLVRQAARWARVRLGPQFSGARSSDVRERIGFHGSVGGAPARWFGWIFYYSVLTQQQAEEPDASIDPNLTGFPRCFVARVGSHLASHAPRDF
jgi:hypothetical protein